jgi:adenylyltransferase/sulfurtransferase
METIKWIIGAGDSLVGRLVLFDALKLRFRELKLRKDPNCPICGEHPTIHELIDYQAFCGIGAESDYAGPEVSVEELQRERGEKGCELVVIDVREPHEWEIATIEGSRLIPLGQLPDRLNELDGHAEIVTVCHHGARSMKALEILRGAGFGKVRSLAGGIDAWAERVEQGMARY